MITVIFKQPGKRAETREIENNHAAIEKLLGGKSEQFRANGYDYYAHENISESTETSSTPTEELTLIRLSR